MPRPRERPGTRASGRADAPGPKLEGSPVRRPPTLLIIGLALAAFFWLRHGASLVAPFFSDDFLFLDEVRGAAFARVFSTASLAYHWYRPWSRELHYWVLERLFGTHPLPYHLMLVALWLATMGAYFLLGRRLAGDAVAALAVCGVATLAAWGIPLEWAAGAQELWMLLLSLLTLLAFTHRRAALAALIFTLALLSKETAVVVPAIAVAWALFVDRDSLRAALTRVAPLAAIAVVWWLLHPALGGRWWWAHTLAPLPAVRTQPLESLAKTLLAMLNLDLAPAAAAGRVAALARAAPAALVLVALAAWAMFADTGDPPRRPQARLLACGSAWAVIGWLPLLMQSVLWQPYYILFGALGAWLALATLLVRHRALAIAVILALALLGGLRAETRSDDWGNEQLQRSSKEFIALTGQSLRRRYPALPRHTRVFFTGVPARTVFVLGPGDTPALRVWYADSTIRGSYWSQYRPRAAGDSVGPDLFFRFDADAGWVEVAKGREDPAASRAANPAWQQDHRHLAKVLFENGDLPAAAIEYTKLARADSSNFTDAYLAGVSLEYAGDTLAAARWYDQAAARPAADDQARAKARRFGALLRRQ